MNRISIDGYTLTSALGTGLDAMRKRFACKTGGLSADPWGDVDVSTWLGRVDIPSSLEVEAPRSSRNNRLARLALDQDGFADRVAGAVQRFGAARCGVAIGTSTSSIGETESAFRTLDADGRFAPSFRRPETHNPHSTAAFVAEALGLGGPAMTVSAACASSAKVFPVAARWLRAGIADAVVVGGVDSLCSSIVYGFHSLQLIAKDVCRPFDRERRGISLGEAGGFALLTLGPSGPDDLVLLGSGESCDAHHMSSAHPEGLGARLAMAAAVTDSGLSFADVDYLNLHGTGTRANDAIEGAVCEELIAPGTRISATKGWTGHALGAAGIVEALICLDALATDTLPGTINTRQPEPGFGERLLLENESRPIRTAMTNSFGFGGNNCTLVLGRGC